ncbi:OmpA family protein [Nonlabens marinus]|uniref:Outer membrane lipoprotein omp16 n=1 Tax=Nonlabens marinus S1-08 TaxID=1454201 RepID=W8W006_9FLAO|nr:OmpA family protein [Nonlabens marinus]BAO55491.1 outer membrane lipoprotein omp16 precursor [Nonlabens marinus S1-08]
MIKKILLIGCIIISSIAHAQQGKIDRASKDFKNLAFIDAQELYLKIASNGFTNQELLAKLGDTYYFNDDLQESYNWYKKMFDQYTGTIQPEYYFRYAQALKSVGKYEESDEYLEKFNSIKGYASITEDSTDEPTYLQLIEFQSGRFTVENAREINSNAADFGPAFLDTKNQIVFTTSRDTGFITKRLHQWNEQAFLDLYTSDVEMDGRLSDARRFSNVLNTRWHESTPNFTPDGKTVYFTRNNSTEGKLVEDANGLTKLKIYKSELVGNEWSEPVELSINSIGFNTAHPALTPDGKSMFFVSDRPGSEGFDAQEAFATSDIWVVSINADGSLGEPSNVKGINTIGRETFPFVSQDYILYFASNGHSGLGGLDVFASTIYNDGTMGAVVNVGKPINTPFDDFGFIVNDETRVGYFSSNRPGGRGDVDIYQFVQLEDLRDDCEILVSGTVTDTEAKTTIENAAVVITDAENNVIDQTLSDSDGKYAFKVKCKSRYFIKASKEHYTADEQLFSTPRISEFINIPLKLTNTKIEVAECDDLAEILDIGEIYFDFNKASIRPDAASELSKILAFLELYPETKIDVRSHSDSRGDDTYNKMLSEERAQSTRQWFIDQGIDSSRVTAKGYGESQLVNNCSNGVACSEEEHQMNRRSEFIVSGLDQYSNCD